MANLTRDDVLRLAIEASVDPRTVRNAYAGKAIRELTYVRIFNAAAKLKLAKPPAPEVK